jgi:flagellar hook assembly protein FlgD
VKIRFNLPEESHLKLNIYDISGKLIKTLIDNPVESGYHSAIWRGDDENGKIVNSGVYFYQIESGKFMETRKLILLR